MLTIGFLSRVVDSVDCCPWSTTVGRSVCETANPRVAKRLLYTIEERQRRDASPWTVVQGVLAPVQFIIFLVSLSLVLNYLIMGTGESAATFSIIVKTLVLYTIMITGSIWERQIFGRYLFAPAFYWEDVVSMLVLALHTAYLAALITGGLSMHQLMILALCAYCSYVINAAQFILKLRDARLQSRAWPTSAVLGLPQ